MSAAEIAAVNARLEAALARGDAAAAAALYTEEAQFLAPNADVVRGRAAIQEFFQGVLDSGVTELEVQTLEIEVLGDTALEVGTYTLVAADGSQADAGKFIVVWKKVDGRWHLHRDMINTSLPAGG